MAEAATRPASGLYYKMALVLGEMERVKKTGWNDAQKYQFAAEGDIVDMVRASLAAHGISFHVEMVEPPVHEQITSKGGTVGDRCTVHLRFLLIDADDPNARESAEWWAHADDYQDKSVGKAITAAKKSWMVARFLISTGESEPDSGGEQRVAAPVATEPHPDSLTIDETRRRHLFAIAQEKGVAREFVTLSARLQTRTREHPHGRSITDLTVAESRALETMLNGWDSRPPEWDEKMGRLAAAMEEAAAAEKAATETAPEDRKPTCTCGVGDDVLDAAKHADGCSMAIPF